MKRFAAMLLLVVTLLFPHHAQAHLGSPDVFYNGLAGPYPVSIAIRMPNVVPGLATITAQVQSDAPVTVEFAPISSKVAASNAPPPEAAEAVPGETNLFSGQLWLMTSGAYSIEVRVHGKYGDGVAQIPVNSVATRQLPLPAWLGGLLAVLALVLFCSGVAIAAAAAGESVFPPEGWPTRSARFRYWIAATVTAAVAVLLLAGGRKWWMSEEAKFRDRVRDGGWPDMTVNVNIKNARRVLTLHLAENDMPNDPRLELFPDHGKLLHVFLVALPNRNAFAHIHPVRSGDKSFDVVVPQELPAGDYEVLCDLTLAKSGSSSTATNIAHIPAALDAPPGPNAPRSDPDDSWAASSANAVHENAGQDTICRMADGTRVIWKAHPPLRAGRDAGLLFQALGPDGKSAPLEPYMGMLCHGAVLRADGRVFAHLHPSGNYSMAAQYFFDSKVGQETGAAIPSHGHGGVEAVCGIPGVNGAATAQWALPYQFPTGGDYRIWVQIKTAARVETAIFDATVP